MNWLVCQYSLRMDKNETKLYVKSNQGNDSDPTMWNHNFLDDFMSFSHYWGGLFAQFVTMLLSLLRFEAICARWHSVSLRLGYGHFNTSNCFFFRHSCCQQEFSSREKQQGWALFLNVFWLHVLLIRVCARPIATLRHKSRSGCCVVSRPLLLAAASQQQQPLWGHFFLSSSPGGVSWNGSNRFLPSDAGSPGFPPECLLSCPTSPKSKIKRLSNIQGPVGLSFNLC